MSVPGQIASDGLLTPVVLSGEATLVTTKSGFTFLSFDEVTLKKS